jgi:hypothetical protein
MKIAFIIGIVLIILLIVFQTYTSMATQKAEIQPYKVVQAEKDFEIRFYPSATMATITSSAKSYKELGSSGFSKLAGYIFGGNDENKQISMTSPVHMEISNAKSTMSFVMPSNYHKSNLPKPISPDVTIETAPEEYVAAIRFSGFASNDDIKKQTSLLEMVLKIQHIEYYGNFRYLGYNPPYQLFGRRNEVIVAVKWNKK